MSEEEEQAIEVFKSYINAIDTFGTIDYKCINKLYGPAKTVLNLIQKQQSELEQLKKKNKELLRKLRNRVKEVKKLEKYSLYKKEFSTLNKQIKKKDLIIDEMAEVIDDTFIADKICEECIKAKLYEEIFEYECEKERKICIKQYFENKVQK